MRLWADGDIESAIRTTVKEQVADINRQVKSRAKRATEIMRTAEREVLTGQRSGNVYRKPYTGGKSKEERKKSGYKPPMYRASAPGEPPARRTGTLRLGWYGDEETRETAKGTEVIAILKSNEKYAPILENGTTKIAPRPFVERIKEKAMPEIKKIYSEPYT